MDMIVTIIFFKEGGGYKELYSLDSWFLQRYLRLGDDALCLRRDIKGHLSGRSDTYAYMFWSPHPPAVMLLIDCK